MVQFCFNLRLLTLWLLCSALMLMGQEFKITLPDKAPVALIAYAKIKSPLVVEASGLAKSKLWPGIYWTHNDSEDEARIIPITRRGEIIQPEWMKNYQGIQIPDAVNVDWEAITTDDHGNLIVGDCGNNTNSRRDLALYFIKEPYPQETVITCVFKRILYKFPDQKEFPAKIKNFDAEGIFWLDSKLYLLTKHRSDSFTKLYCLTQMDPNQENELTLLESFNIQGQVTSADISGNGRKLLILTTNSVWLFDRASKKDNFFSGKVYWLPIEAKKCEAICFDSENDFLICNEEGELFELKFQDLLLVSK